MSREEAIETVVICYALLPLLQLQACGEAVSSFHIEEDGKDIWGVMDADGPITSAGVQPHPSGTGELVFGQIIGMDKWGALEPRSGKPTAARRRKASR